MNNYNKLKCNLIVITGIILFTVIFSRILILKHINYRPVSQDFTYRLQAFYNFVNTGSMDETVYEKGNLFYFHFEPVILFFMPVFLFFNCSPVILLILQVFIIALSGVPLFLIAEKKLGSVNAILILFFYYMYTPLQFSATFIFIPFLLGIFFINWALYFLFIKQNFKYLLLNILGAILCQEFYCFAGMIIGVSLFIFRKNYKKGLVLCLINIFIFLFISLVFFPVFKNNSYLSESREINSWWYGYIKNTGIAEKILTVSSNLFSLKNLNYSVRLLLPLLFLPVISPYVFIIVIMLALPFLASEFNLTKEIYTYYNSPLVPFIFLSLILSLKKIKWTTGLKMKMSRGLYLLLALAAILNFIYESPVSLHNRPFIYYPNMYYNSRREIIDEAVEYIPDRKSVLVIPSLSEKLFRRPELKMTLVNNLLNPDCEYILMDLKEFNWIEDIEKKFTPVFLQELKNLIFENKYKVLFHENGILLLKKNEPYTISKQNISSSLKNDFDYAFKKAFTNAGIPDDKLKKPFIYSLPLKDKSVSGIFKDGVIQLPVIAGGYFFNSSADFAELNIYINKKPFLKKINHGFYYIFSIDVSSFPVGENIIILEGIAGDYIDSCSFKIVIDRTKPDLFVEKIDSGKKEFRIRTSDSVSNIECFYIHNNNKILLTPPLIRFYLDKQVKDIYYKFPGGVTRFDRKLSFSKKTGDIEIYSVDLAGNVNRVTRGVD